MVARRGPCSPASRRYFAAWVIIAFVTLVEGAKAVKVKSAQADALINIRTELNPLDSTLFESWSKTNACADWLGLKCDASGNVISLIVTSGDVLYPNGSTLATATYDSGDLESDVYENQYNGTLSDSVSDLKYLKTLIFNTGSLYGPIPATIGNLTNLKILILANQVFDGAIPESVGNLTQLEYLDFSENQYTDEESNLITSLNGTLPPTLSALVNLKYLALQGCNFTGSPTFIKNFTKLVYLNLENNPLTTSLPDILGDFADLQYMYLRGISSPNSGEFPKIISSYTNLKILSLVNAAIYGSIPPSFINLVNLEELDLSENQITNISSNLSSLIKLKSLKLAANALISIDYVTDLTSLTHLEIQMNGLTGPLPDLSRLQSLEYLDAGYNFFRGTVDNVVVGIPDYLAKFTNLTSLNLDSNLFGGNLSLALTNLTNLDTFSCAQCGLEGLLPPQITKLTALTYLDLHGNSLIGEIPRNIGKLTNLDTLDLSFNDLTGTIPASLKDTAITDLRLNNNGLIGNITNSLVISIGVLWLHSNNFTGPIPSEIGSLESLSDIQLQDNRLRSNIPPELWNLPQTDTKLNIDLSRNFLGGRFPKGISRLEGTLASLRLSKCGLSGSLPDGLSKLVNLEYLDLSQNSFTGALPSLKNLTKLLELTLSGNGLDIDISSLPNSPLQNLNLGAIGVESGGLPDFPAIYYKSLLTLSLQSNYIYGNLNMTYFDSFSKLQAVFLQENQLSGNFTPFLTRGSLEYISLAKNSLNALILGNLSNELSLDLSDNPLCETSKDNSIVKYCNSSGNTVNNYEALAVCSECKFGNNKFNPYIYEQSSTCVCSGFLNFQISFSPTKLAYISKQSFIDVTKFLNNGSGLDPFQVSVASASISGNPPVLSFSMRVFGTDQDAPSIQVRKFFSISLADAAGKDIPGLGNLDYTRTLATVDFFPIPPSPPPPPSPPSSTTIYNNKKSGIEGWLIAVIAVVAGVFLLTTILLAGFMYYNYDRETMLEIKVGEGFVKGIPLAEVRTATDDFSERNLLGVGGYGFVYKGVAPNGEIWAVKRAKTISLKGLQEFEQEVSIISKMSHANIVKLLGFCDRRNEQILVYEFMKNGSLKGLLRPEEGDMSKPPLSFGQRLDIAIGAAEGLLYLHKFARPPVIHRDIKSDNILLDENFTAKVADFGLLKDNPTGSTEDAMNTRVAGTPGYIDPEYFTNFQVTAKSDVYSFGVVLLELITARSALIKEETTTDPDIPNVTTLANWVQPFLNDIGPIVDPRMGDYHDGAMKMLVKIATVCTERAARYRPAMDEVARRLGQAKNVFLGVEETDVSSHEDSDAGGSLSSHSAKYTNFSSTSKSNLAPLSESYGGR